VVFRLEKSKSYYLGDFFECWGKIFLHCVGACKKIAKDTWNSLYVNFEMNFFVNPLHFERVLYI
jgi:hypothetical protein